MASWVLSECGVRPLPRVFPRPRTGTTVANSIVRLPSAGCKEIGAFYQTDLRRVSVSDRWSSRSRDWGLRVSAPLKVASLDVEEDGEQQGEILSSSGDDFDPSAPPPLFGLADIRAAIPKHCWVKDPWKSMSYVVRDVAIVFGLAAGAAYLNNWFGAAQGTMFWAIFVLGHDCSGHGSFSNDHKLNSVVGHLLHSSILVPYHGWRISHRTHHQNHGHVENEESWHPEATIDIKLPRRSLLVEFTCNACGDRTKRLVNRLAYERGTIFVQCAGCLKHHRLVDNLGLVVEYDFREDVSTDLNAEQNDT